MTLATAPATHEDLHGITGIYDHYVRTTVHTFDTEPRSSDEWGRWFHRFGVTGRRRLFVSREEGTIRGYALSDTYRDRPAYDPSVLTSVYVAPDHLGEGVGSALYASLLTSLRGEDVHRAYAAIAMPNVASVRLHEHFGFDQRGYFSEQGRKFDRYWDVAWYELRFGVDDRRDRC